MDQKEKEQGPCQRWGSTYLRLTLNSLIKITFKVIDPLRVEQPLLILSAAQVIEAVLPVEAQVQQKRCPQVVTRPYLPLGMVVRTWSLSEVTFSAGPARQPVPLCPRCLKVKFKLKLFW